MSMLRSQELIGIHVVMDPAPIIMNVTVCMRNHGNSSTESHQLTRNIRMVLKVRTFKLLHM